MSVQGNIIKNAKGFLVSNNLYETKCFLIPSINTAVICYYVLFFLLITKSLL